MSHPLLLDEMFSDAIAQQLRAKGYDVVSVSLTTKSSPIRRLRGGQW